MYVKYLITCRATVFFVVSVKQNMEHIHLVEKRRDRVKEDESLAVRSIWQEFNVIDAEWESICSSLSFFLLIYPFTSALSHSFFFLIFVSFHKNHRILLPHRLPCSLLLQPSGVLLHLLKWDLNKAAMALLFLLLLVVVSAASADEGKAFIIPVCPCFSSMYAVQYFACY